MNEEIIRAYLLQYGKKFRKLRKQAEFTQLQAAQCVQCSQAIISHIECGYFMPPPRLEKALLELYQQAQKDE